MIIATPPGGNLGSKSVVFAASLFDLSVLLALAVSFDPEAPVVAAAESVEEAFEPDAEAESVTVFFEESVEEAAEEDSVDEAPFDDEESEADDEEDEDSIKNHVNKLFSTKIMIFRTVRVLPS